MSQLFSLYFNSLLKRFLLLCLICSFVSLTLLAYSYDTSIVMMVFRDNLLTSIPWLLLFQQLVFCAFITPPNFISRVYLVVFSTILSALILLLTFPYTQREFNIQLNQITPNIVQPNNKIIVSDRGTFIIDPNSLPHSFYASTNSKALWISNNLFSFDGLKTNSQSFELTSPHSLSSYGLQPQNGTAILPFFTQKNTPASSPNGQKLIQEWLSSTYAFNQTIKELFKSIGFTVKSQSASYFQKINTKQELPTVQSTNTNSIEEYKKFVKSTKELSLPLPVDVPVSVVDYLNVFTSILCLFALLALLGIIISLGQHFVGLCAITMLIALFIPRISMYFFEITLQFSKLVPSFSILLVNITLTAIFYSASVILYSFKKQKGRIPSKSF